MVFTDKEGGFRCLEEIWSTASKTTSHEGTGLEMDALVNG